MSTIEITSASLIVHLRWIDRLLCWRPRVVTPLHQVRSAELGIAPDMRLVPGEYMSWIASNLPGKLNVGAFIRRDGIRLFYITRRGENAITIRLTGARYAAIVVEVAEPAATVAAINAAVGWQAPA